MFHLLFFQLYLVIMQLLLAGKDADSYLLKSKTDDDITSSRINRWHRDGVLLFIVSSIPVFLFGWYYVILALLVRLAVFDICFNLWSGLSLTYLGSTAAIDKFFGKIFGQNGAIKKSVAAIVLIVIFDIVIALLVKR